MKQMTKTVATLAVAGIVGLSAAAFADAGEVRALGEAKISLTDAIKAAESYQGGRALDAGIDDDSFTGPAYEVSVVRDGRIFDVQVNGSTGKVLGAREDLDD